MMSFNPISSWLTYLRKEPLKIEKMLKQRETTGKRRKAELLGDNLMGQLLCKLQVSNVAIDKEATKYNKARLELRSRYFISGKFHFCR